MPVLMAAHCLCLFQVRVLKVGVGYEKLGLGGKWILHDANSANQTAMGIQ
jgi:hypothetical protein